MKKRMKFLSFCLAMVVALLAGGPALAKKDGQTYNVTITNLTYKQVLTPPIVISHKDSFKLFTLGQPASDELAALAEGGNTQPLTALLGTRDDVFDFVTASEPILPGASITLQIKADKFFTQLSLAGMLATTNDGFFAVNGIGVPLYQKELSAVAYDAGSEKNTQLCSDVPGPPCDNGENMRVTEGAEGFVYVHGGIHDQGDLNAADMDWRNPVAHVAITRGK